MPITTQRKGSVLLIAGLDVSKPAEYIGEQSSYGRCSADWKKARKEVQADEKMRSELVERLKQLT